MRIITIIILGEKPVSNNKYYSGMHWSSRRKEVDRVHMLVRAALDPNESMFEEPVDIEMRVYFKDRRVQLDCSNIPLKLYEDGLIGWLIEDDKPQFVRSVKTVSLLDRKNPRVEIEVKSVADDGVQVRND